MKEILCFGDSNTYGLIPGTTSRFDRSTRWTGILESALFPNGYKIVEEGLCGRTTIFEDELRDNRRGIDMLPALLESHSPIVFNELKSRLPDFLARTMRPADLTPIPGTLRRVL